MSEHDAVDRAIAERIRSAAAGSAAVPLLRLEEASHRGRRIRRRRRHVAVAGVVLLVLAVPAATVVAVDAVRHDRSTAPTPADSTRLLGTFTTDVPAGAAAGAPVAGRWTLVLHGDGTIAVQPPPAYQGVVTGSDYQATGDTVRLNLFVQDLCSAAPVGQYRWARDEAGLHFTVLSDGCAARRLVLSSAAWRPGI